ncbi:accessory gland protein Acp53Ea-like [Drosophila gunungcola]|uniref:accessory gland protein Acp53Ea-like n=1 Tax=Drosophila gunungcola TaxID=103775 RepID=UPI0022E09874|nr:accessory gland protein Acp53Ea-like [Drosophila gunungcola]
MAIHFKISFYYLPKFLNMRSNQLIFTTFSMILLASLVPFNVAQKIDLDKLSSCAEVAIKAGNSLASKSIPSIRKLATCVKFTPLKTKNLDIVALALLGYQFLQKVIGNQKCLLSCLKESYEMVSPHLNKIVQMKCLSF